MTEKLFTQLAKVRKIRLDKAKRQHQKAQNILEKAEESQRHLEHAIAQFTLSIPAKKKLCLLKWLKVQ